MAYKNQKVKARQVVVPNTQTQDLGIVSEVPMGDWSAATQYYKLNTVRYGGATYKAKKQNQGVEPTVTAGWQEVWQVVAYDGALSPVGNYPGMTVGNATNAQNATAATNDGTGNNIAEQFEKIDSYIPSSTSADNQLADKAFVNSSINNMAAFYIESNAQGDAWPTRASLLNATTFYNAGKVRVPTTNDYATVLADESQPKGADGTYPTTRYSYQGGTYPNGQWGFQYVVNNTALTQAQVDAINSGITKELVEQIGEGGLFEIPYDLSNEDNPQAKAEFIKNNIEQIKRGAYFVSGNDCITIESVFESGNGNIDLRFWAGSFPEGDQYARYFVSLLNGFSVTKDKIDGGNFVNSPQLLTGKTDTNGTIIEGDGLLVANEENNGKVVGVENGAFAMVDVYPLAHMGFGSTLTISEMSSDTDVIIPIINLNRTPKENDSLTAIVTSKEDNKQYLTTLKFDSLSINNAYFKPVSWEEVGGGVFGTIVETANKNLYNLGAFDTIVTNSDGTVTITRQTGYLYLNGSEAWKAQLSTETKVYRMMIQNYVPDITSEQTTRNKMYVANSILSTASGTWGGVEGIAIGADKYVYYYSSQFNTANSVTAFKEWLSQNPIVLQYKTNTPYTEKVIENQPIHTFNQEQENKLREYVGDIIEYNVSVATEAENQHDTVVKYYRSSDGLTWYRIWASGWKECGGFISMYVSNSDILLPVNMVSANYNVSISMGGLYVRDKPAVVSSKAVNKFTVIHEAGLNGEFGIYWYVCGY